MRFYLTVALMVVLLGGCAMKNGACGKCCTHDAADEARTSQVGIPIENDVVYY